MVRLAPGCCSRLYCSSVSGGTVIGRKGEVHALGLAWRATNPAPGTTLPCVSSSTGSSLGGCEGGAGAGDREPDTGEHAAVFGQGEEPSISIERVPGAPLLL